MTTFHKFGDFVQNGCGGDSYYIEESRSIAEGIKYVESIAQLLEVAQPTSRPYAARIGDTEIHDRLRTARDATAKIHRQLRDFAIFVSAEQGKTHRSETYDKLRRRYQSALKRLEAAAEDAITRDGVGCEDSVTPSQVALHPLSGGKSGPSGGVTGSGVSRFDLWQSSRRWSDGSTASSTHVEDPTTANYSTRYVQPVAKTVGMLDHKILTERQSCIAAIHKDIEGIQDLYLEMNYVTENQGDNIDATEDQMHKTATTSALATEHIQRAHSYQRTQFKRISFLLFLILGVVLTVIFVYKEF